MKVRVFTLQLDPETRAFEDGEVRAFVEAHEVLGVYEHLLHHDGEPLWAVLVTYRDRTRPGQARPPQVEREAALEVPEADRALFAALRRWRNERAKRDGRPAYVLFRNAQLADIARIRPATLAALREVHGVGEAKARDYGPELLALVAEVAAVGPPEAAEPPATDG
jgi:superfamily II DNA helicase RecQ